MKNLTKSVGVLLVEIIILLLLGGVYRKIRSNNISPWTSEQNVSWDGRNSKRHMLYKRYRRSHRFLSADENSNICADKGNRDKSYVLLGTVNDFVLPLFGDSFNSRRFCQILFELGQSAPFFHGIYCLVDSNHYHSFLVLFDFRSRRKKAENLISAFLLAIHNAVFMNWICRGTGKGFQKRCLFIFVWKNDLFCRWKRY